MQKECLLLSPAYREYHECYIYTYCALKTSGVQVMPGRGGVCQSLDKEKRHQICPVTLIFLQMDFKTSYSDTLSELDFLTFNKCIYHLPMLHLSFWWRMVGTPPLPLCTPLLKALQLKLINPTVTVGCVGHLALARNLVLTFQAAYKNTRLEYNCWL